MFKTLKSPILVQWEVTPECNKNCIHCYNYWRDMSSKISNESLFDDGKAEKIVNSIIDNEVFHVVITGGEPLLVFKKLLPYLKHLRNHNVSISINTNMAAMNDEVAETLISLGIKHCLVSFPAHTEDLDFKITHSKTSYEATIEGIRIAKKHGLNITANMVISTINFAYIEQVASKAKSIGVDKFCVNMAVPPDNCKDFSSLQISKEQLQKLPQILMGIKQKLNIKVGSVEAYPLCFIDNMELLKDSGFNRLCSAGKTFCVISPQGEVRPCILLSDNCGNDLAKAWESMSQYRDGSMLPEECGDCKYSSTCDGGCKAQAKKNTCSPHIDPYANFENKHRRTMSSLQVSVPTQVFDDDVLFRINPKLRFRTESFGGILFLYNDSWVAVDKKTYDYLLSKVGVCFSFFDYCQHCSSSKISASKTLNFLISKKIVETNFDK